MKSQTGIIVLIFICIGLAGALIWSRKRAADQKSSDELSIGTFSNKWVETIASLEQQRQVNTSLEGDLNNQRAAYTDLTNAYTDVSSNLDLTRSALKASQDTVDAFYAISDFKGWVLGETLEHALAALQRELAGDGGAGASEQP